jgi:hypothetical protein
MRELEHFVAWQRLRLGGAMLVAIRAYEILCFRGVGIVGECGPDGVWHGGLLMDILKEDFRR